ncbi:MAG: hypothetical protein EBU46_01855 [Nitrosomonadaceae bacterium]|nr:hypothetical protein [Nitrosomonadaceae bacterium]
MSNELIVGCSLSLSNRTSPDQIWVSRVVVVDRMVNVEISWGSTVVAVAGGRVTEDNQMLDLNDKEGNRIGCCYIGNASLVSKLTASYQFQASASLLESSCVKYYPAPRVTGLKHGDSVATGQLTLSLNNLKLLQLGDRLLINVSSLQQIDSRGDKTSQWLTCDNAVITGINDVRPEPGTGLIELYGVAPVTVTVTSNGIQVGLADGISLDTLCKDVNLPASSNSNVYKGYLDANDPDRNVLTTNDPEWKDWPQYSDN